MARRATRRKVVAILGMGSLSGCLSLSPSDGANTAPETQNTSESNGPNDTTEGDLESSNTSEDQWPVSIPAPATTAPLQNGDTVLLGSKDHHVYALDRKTGSQEFKTEVGDQVGPGLTVVDDVVYGSSPAGIFGIDLTTSEQILTISDRDLGFGIYEPLVVDGQLFYPFGRSMNAFDTTSGEKNWSQNTGTTWGGKPALVNGTLVSSDAGDVESFPSDRSRIYGLDPQDGSIQWQKTVSEDGLVSPVAAHDEQGIAVLVGRYGLTAAFDADSGEELWRTTVDRNGNVPGNPEIIGETVVVPLGSNGVYAYDITTGDERWKKDGRGEVNTGFACETRDGNVFTTGGNTIFEIDATSGELVSTVELSVPLAEGTQPLVTETAVIYPTEDATIDRLDRQ